MFRSFALAGAVVVGLSGCIGGFGGVRQELPVPLEITLSAAERVNPTEAGRPSPIVVRVFELSNSAAFQSADFFALQDGGSGATGEVVESEEYVLVPGEVRVVRKRAALNSRFLGVVAGYRDLEGSVWRAVVPLPAPHLAGRVWAGATSPKQGFYIVLGERAVMIREAPR
ncbi:MAG: type VI secretion system lipoprotein TssJ [Rhodocyclaceae bacterium]